jgi:nitrite reductase/ring-hydroxylating ferredoxin subunit
MQENALIYQKLYPYPNGWYIIATSTELKPYEILSKTFMGEEIVLFRTESGKVSAMYAYCPHLGAHLGLGGKIVGENIKCPFHHFEFDVTGTCVKTGYNTPPPKCKTSTWLIQEKNGLLIIWHDAKKNSPEWEIPELDWTDWSPLISDNLQLKSHPQESSENSVDVGHFSIVHGYEAVRIIQEPFVEGAFLKGRYGFEREGFLGRYSKKVKAEFEFTVMGLGCSFVEAEVPELGIKTRHFVFACPIDVENTRITIALSMKKLDNPAKIHPLLKLVPYKILQSIILHFAFKNYRKDVMQDFFVWGSKKYIPHPALAKGDGPVGLYRRYVKQFYYPDVVDKFRG